MPYQFTPLDEMIEEAHHEGCRGASEIDPILLEREVWVITRLSPSIRKREVKAGRFPEPVVLAGNLHGWRRSDIVAWVRALKPAA